MLPSCRLVVRGSWSEVKFGKHDNPRQYINCSASARPQQSRDYCNANKGATHSLRAIIDPNSAPNHVLELL
jgi:hypothetical protein